MVECDKSINLITEVPVVFEKENNCVVFWAHRLVTAVTEQNCGKNVFCREGMAQLKKILGDIADGRGQSDDIDLMTEICEAIELEADCGLSKDAAHAVKEAVNANREDIETHIKRKRCPALKCRHLVSYYVSGEKCTGCGECLSKCPEDAISGGEGMIHVISQDDCTKCGICYDICSKNADAVIKAGSIAPRTPEKPVPVGTWKAKVPGLGLRRGLKRN